MKMTFFKEFGNNECSVEVQSDETSWYYDKDKEELVYSVEPSSLIAWNKEVRSGKTTRFGPGQDCYSYNNMILIFSNEQVSVFLSKKFDNEVVIMYNNKKVVVDL